MDWTINVSEAVFEPLEEPLGDMVMQVSIAGSGFAERAIPPVARVGDVPLQRIMVSPQGDGIVGFLDTEPDDGARLVVGYLGEEMVETGITYHGGGGPEV
jgi:hypothetical protein